jgi:hypothetical protein
LWTLYERDCISVVVDGRSVEHVKDGRRDVGRLTVRGVLRFMSREEVEVEKLCVAVVADDDVLGRRRAGPLL